MAITTFENIAFQRVFTNCQHCQEKVWTVIQLFKDNLVDLKYGLHNKVNVFNSTELYT